MTKIIHDFKHLVNPTFLQACTRQASTHTPVWLMRQAGRYLPEYRETRAKAGSFMGLATNTDYATEVTMQPLESVRITSYIPKSNISNVAGREVTGDFFSPLIVI